MTKEDLVNQVATRSKLPKIRIAAALDLFLSEVSDALARQEKVEIRRFGVFDVSVRQARVARNLNANGEIRLSDRIMPRFVPFTAFKDRVLTPDIPSDKGNTKTADKITVPPASPPKTPVPRIETLERQVASERENADARLLLIDLYIESDRYAEALPHCRAGLGIDLRSLELLNRQGRISEQTGIFDQALQAYDQAVNFHPSHVESLLNRGRMRSQTGRYAEAEQDFRRALEIDPSKTLAVLQCGLLYTRRGLYLRALQEFERAWELDPSSPEACFNLGKTYDHLERHDEAIRQFETLVVLQPDHPRPYWHLGMLYNKKKMGEKALKMYQQSNRLSTLKKGNDRT